MDEGFEALMDGVLLLTVLLVATGIVTALAVPRAVEPPASSAEDLRAALFRTTMDGLGYVGRDGPVVLRNGTTVEAFLRLQVHLTARGVPADFAAANARVLSVAHALAGPGRDVAILGSVGEATVLRLPHGGALPPTYAAASWTYPPLDGAGADVTLSVAVWLSPPR